MADYTLSKTGSQIDTMLTDPLAVSLGGTGQTSARTTDTLTSDGDNTTDFSSRLVYFPYLGMVYVRGNFKLSNASVANTWITVANVPSTYRPSTYNPAITVSCPSGGSGLLTRADGNINIRTNVDRAVGTSVDFSGWWYL